MAQCSEISLLLGAFEDGELEPNEMQEVARHLARCESCERELADFSRLGRLLRNETVLPPLEGFSDAVLSRVECLRPPLTVRLSRWLDAAGEFLGPRLGLATAMAVAAVATAFIITPVARNLVHHSGEPAAQLAANSVSQTIAPPLKAVEAVESKMPSAAAPQIPATLADNSIAPSAIISRLETSNPDVAVWSEPRHGTTVIWLPDQP